MNFISRTLLMLILVLPSFVDNQYRLFFIIAIIIVTSDIIFSIYRVGWLVWVMDIAPLKNRSNYIYMRMFYLRCAFAAMTLVSGFILDKFDKGYTGFVILFGASYLLSLVDLFVLKGIREKPYVIDRESNFFKLFFVPPKVKQYREYLIFIFLFYFSYFIAAAYTPVYMIKYLEFEYRFILSMNVVSMLAMIFSNLFWLKIENLKGSRFVLNFCSLLQAAGLLIIGFLTEDRSYLLFFSSVFLGLGAGGFNTTSFSYRYELMPEISKTIYESWFYLVFGVSTLVAPFAGRFLMDLMPEVENAVLRHSKIQLLYFISFACLCISVIFTQMKYKYGQKIVSQGDLPEAR